MKTLFLPIGMQASGKTTWAKELCKTMNKKGSQNRVVLISRDEYRSMLAGGMENYTFGNKLSNEVESMITVAAIHQAELAVAKNLNIVVADMNLNPSVQRSWKKFAKDNNMNVVVKDFYQEYLAGEGSKLDLPVAEDEYLAEMIKRDLQRTNSIGAPSLATTFAKYLQSELVQHKHMDGLPSAVIFDLDGTLFHMNDRSAYDWKKCIDDTVDNNVADILRMYYDAGHTIILMSGRNNVCETETKQSLSNNNIPYHHLFMRDSKDQRKDNITKNELFQDNIEGNYNVLCAFDDRDCIVSLWRRKGIKCFQCEYGNF